MTFVFSCLTHFTQRDALRVRPRCRRGQLVVLLWPRGSPLSVCTASPHGHSRGFRVLATVGGQGACISSGERSRSFRHTPEDGLLGRVRPVCSFLRKLRTVFHTSSTNLNFHPLPKFVIFCLF